MNAKAQEQTVEMGLHRPPRHLQLLCDIRVVAALQEQFHNLLLPRGQTNRLLHHSNISLFGFLPPWPRRFQTGIPLPLSTSPKHTCQVDIRKSVALILPCPTMQGQNCEIDFHTTNRHPRAARAMKCPSSQPTGEFPGLQACAGSSESRADSGFYPRRSAADSALPGGGVPEARRLAFLIKPEPSQWAPRRDVQQESSTLKNARKPLR